MGLFDDNDGHNNSCPWTPGFDENAKNHLIGSWTFYKFNVVVSGACTAFAFIAIFTLMGLHATHLTKPNEQLKIMKIALLIPLYSTQSLLAISFPSAHTYLDPWLELPQSIALVSFFLLLCEFVSPSPSQRTVFLAALEPPAPKKPPKKPHKKPKKPSPGALPSTPAQRVQWYRKKWLALFQYPVVALGVAVATDITEAAGVYCESSDAPKHAQIWLSVIINISVTLAVTAVVLFYTALAKSLAHYRPLAKLAAFKLVVGLGFFQGIVFWVLRSTGVLVPTDTLTYADVIVGLPTMCTCVEMVPISVFFWYAYGWGPYVLGAEAPLRPAAERGEVVCPPMSYQGGVFGCRAWLALLSPRETLEGMRFAFQMAGEIRDHKRSAGKGDEYGDATSLEPLQSGGEREHAYEQHNPFEDPVDHAMGPYSQTNAAYTPYQPQMQPPPSAHNANWDYTVSGVPPAGLQQDPLPTAYGVMPDAPQQVEPRSGSPVRGRDFV